MDPRLPPKMKSEEVPQQGNAFFKSVGGLKSESEVADYQEGGVSGFTRKVIGPMKWPILLIVLGALTILAGGLIFLGILFDDCSIGTECPPANSSGDKLPRTEDPADDAPAVIEPAVTSAPPAEVQPSASGCTCAGVDQICTQVDGSQTVSYNATACGGSGECQCRDPNRTLVCPDGTYADFNPQCGVGGGQCTCVCDAYDANQNCVAGHDSCNPQVTCLP